VRRHLGCEMRARPFAVEVDDAHVTKLGRPRDERVEEDRRRRRSTLEVDLLTGRDPGDGLGRSDDAHLSSIGQVEVSNGRRGAGNRSAARGVRGTVAHGGFCLDDAGLIGRARTGDVAAYETLVRRYQDLAMRTAYVVAPEADAADAVQEAFLKAYAALPRFREEAPFRPWLLKIVANEARNRRRSAERRSGLALRAAVLNPGPSVGGSPEAEVLAAETRDHLRAALAVLRDEDREVIGARFLLGLSEAETAESLSLPRGTVKSRTSRALGRLRESLAVIEGGPVDG
jgi:RNA polymerase sigma factor (sigma-70 family)